MKKWIGWLYSWYARRNYKAGKLEKAYQSQLKAIYLGRANAEDFYLKGVIAYDRQVFHEAISAFEQVLRLDPGHAKSCLNLGILYTDLGNYEKALLYYEAAIKNNSEFALAYYNRARIYIEQSKYKEAIIDLDKSIAIKPTADAFNNRGLSYYFLEQYPEAISDYNQAILLEPAKAQFYQNRGQAKYANRDLEGAGIDMDKAHELNHN